MSANIFLDSANKWRVNEKGIATFYYCSECGLVHHEEDCACLARARRVYRKYIDLICKAFLTEEEKDIAKNCLVEFDSNWKNYVVIFRGPLNSFTPTIDITFLFTDF